MIQDILDIKVMRRLHFLEYLRTLKYSRNCSLHNTLIHTKLGETPNGHVRSDTVNSNLMIPDFPLNIRIRLAQLIFCSPLTLISLCPVSCLSFAFLNNMNNNYLPFFHVCSRIFRLLACNLVHIFAGLSNTESIHNGVLRKGQNFS